MPDMQKLLQDKEKILSTIRIKGPSLPVQIAKALEIEPILASAFLSELKAEQKLKVSDMRVGSSPLYYLPNQESQLENFIQHLNSREKEALSLLKQQKVIEDESLSPVQRVALRSLKDFAIPIRIRIKEQVKLFWKYFLLNDSDFMPLIQKAISHKTIEKTIQKKQEIIQQPIPQKQFEEEDKTTPAPKIPKLQITQESLSLEPTPHKEQTTQQTKHPQKKIEKTKKQKQHEFPNSIKSYLQAKDVEILSVLNEKKRELTAKIRIDTMFGKQSFFLIAKNKKSISENDITLALQQAQSEKMPALILSPGDIAKKAQEHAKQWQNLVKFEKINL